MLRCIEQRPSISQRQLAAELGISLGKTNYCIRALIDKGWVKVSNFKNSDNKLAYRYMLTPKGLSKKTVLTQRFLARKRAECGALKEEIAALEREASVGAEIVTSSRDEK